MPQLAAATKPHHRCLFAAIHCEKPFISIRVAIMCVRFCHSVIFLCFETEQYRLTAQVAQVVEHQLRDREVIGPQNTKGVKNGTSGYLAWCSAL